MVLCQNQTFGNSNPKPSKQTHLIDTCVTIYFSNQVQFILRQTGDVSNAQNRRLAEAKSPKPQRRRTAIKKSMSFSGGAQSTTPPSRSPRLQPQPDEILEEDVQSDPNYVSNNAFILILSV